MVNPKLTDIFKDSACVEDSVGATADASEDISFEEISAGAPRKQTEVVVVQERRRRYSAQEKIEFAKLTYAPGNSVSSIARQYNISPSLLFKWRQLYKAGGLGAIISGTETASAKEVAQLKDEIKRLHRLVGKQAADLELYKEAMEIMREKNGLRANPSAEKLSQASHLPTFWVGALASIQTGQTSQKLG